MARATSTVVLSKAWTQISTGSETYTLSVTQGAVVLCDSDTQPAANATGHLAQQYGAPWMVTPPSIVWARANGEQAIVVRSGG